MNILEVTNLSKSFNSFKAVKEINIEIKEKKVFGFLGPNGAGKTTTIRMIVGLLKPDSGEIRIASQKRVFGQTTGSNSYGYLSEEPSFYSWMSAIEYLSFIAEIFKIDNPNKKIQNLIKTVNLKQAKDKKIATFSKGMKQRLGIAQALINDPQLLILDEPLSALDPLGRKEMLEIIKKLREEKTVFMSTHILADVDKICDDVAIINKGEIVAQSSLQKLKAKYATNALLVEFAKNPQKIIVLLKKKEWLKKIEQENNTLKIFLKDNSALLSNDILKQIADFDIAITKYTYYLPEVEEVFMGLIK